MSNINTLVFESLQSQMSTLIEVGNNQVSPGIEVDILHPRKYYRQLFADWRYIGNVGYTRLKKGQTWGNWTIPDMVKYIARIVDALRSVYFPIIPPKPEDKAYNTPYWEIYRLAEPQMKSKAPDISQVKEWDKMRKELIGK